MTAPAGAGGGGTDGERAGGAILNWREIDAVLAELDLAGCFIRDVRQPAHHRLVFELYAPRQGRTWMLAALGGPYVRLHRLAQRPHQLGDPQRFVAFMRAHVRSARIRAASQVAGERIVKLEVARGDRELLIWIRLWANAANCIVTDTGGAILDALFRRPRRGEISGGVFHPERDLAAPAARGDRHRARPVRAFGNPGESYNLRVERHFAALEADAEAQRAARIATAARAAGERRTRRLIARLRRECEAAGNHGRLQQLGSLLLANLARVQPGARQVVVDDYHTGGTTAIDLAPDRSPADNAQRYFERARNARRRLQAARSRLAQAERELAAAQAAGPAHAPAASAGAASGPADRPAAARPGRGGGVGGGGLPPPGGRRAAQNAAALRAARGNDWWFHCRDFPGAHVLVRERGSSVPLETMLDAASLAVFFSKARSSGQADVYYTQVKYLRRPGARDRGPRPAPGRVIPTRERNLFIKLQPERIDRLLAQRR
ncbi:MAG: NFACT RNA binding domain-containing protein [Spirochaetaceae bacterium]|nr:NFACT RNA binding domain-containing protein [Spirochaetaceae bacterium]